MSFMVPAAWSGLSHPVLGSNAMDAAVWTAIGLLAATSLGTLLYLGSRIDALAARMDAGFDRVDARFDHIDHGFAQVDTKFAWADARFDGLDARLDALNARVDTHLDRHSG
jgi:hypothetical protein